MKKIKTLLVLSVMLIVSVLCGTLTACGGGGDDSNKVTITYYMTSTSLPKTLSVEKGEEYSMAVLPKMDHYVFQGMYETPDGSGSAIIDKFGNSTIVFTSDMTLYVIWAPLSYTLEFDAGEGTMRDTEKTMEVAYGSTITTMPEAELVGHDFLGWYIDDVAYSSARSVVDEKQEFIEKNYKIPKKSTDKITLTAKYEIKKLKVYFDYQDYSTMDEITIEYGQTIPFDKFPVKDIKGEKEVACWSVDRYTAIDFEDPVTEDITLYAIWRYYKIIKLYEDVGGTPKEVRVYKDTPISAPTPTSRTGYEFWGWCTSKTFSNSTPTTSLSYSSAYSSLYARWDPITYTLNFETNGGTCDTSPIYYTIEDEKALPTPVKENYTFLGWCKKSDLSDTPMTTLPKGTANVTKLYAKYRGEDRKVVLNAGDGTLSTSSKTVEYGANFTLPVPTYAGYAFVGWYDSPNVGATQITSKTGASINPITTAEKEITVYAHYKQKYFVTVNVNKKPAGSVSVNEYYLEGDTVSLTATINDGYSFDGWFIGGSAVETSSTYEFTMGASNVTIDAKFSANIYTVTFDVGEGTCSSPSQKVTYGEEFTFPVAELSGYRFVYWEYNGEMIADYEGKGCYVWNILTDITVTAFFYEDDGNTTFVYNADTFKAMKDNPSASYVLVRDVDMSGVTWTPFWFSGTFDGNGFEITNLSVSSSSGNLGVFTKVSGTIKNIIFNDLIVKSTSYESVLVGGVCAELTGTIDGVTVGEISRFCGSEVTGDFCTIGGIAGKVNGGTITNCVNYAVVKSTTYETAVAAGGIVGHFVSGNITSCKNYGYVDITECAGGIIGRSDANTFSNLENGDGALVNGKNNVGGIVGYFSRFGTYAIVSSLVNAGHVYGDSCVGGIFGKISNVRNAYNEDGKYTLTIGNLNNTELGCVRGGTYVGGVIGYLEAYVSGDYADGYVIVTANVLSNAGTVCGNDYLGGLIGYASSDNGESSINGSTSSATLEIKGGYSGGLAGQLKNIKLIGCSNEDSTLILDSFTYETDGTSYYAYIGGYVGYGYYVEGCDNAVEITYNDKGSYVGGIAGRLSNAIKECSNTANITASNSSYVGGLVGDITCSGDYTLAMLENSGKVKGKNYVGGIIGSIYNLRNAYNIDTHYTLKILKLTNSEEISGEENLGGVIGYIEVYVIGDYSDGSVTVTALELNNTGNIKGGFYSADVIRGGKHVGGLIGYASSDNGNSSITGSNSHASVSARFYVGGLAGQLNKIKLVNCSNESSTIISDDYIYADDFKTKLAYVGGYVGYGYYVEGCNNAVEITREKEGNYVGGIAGRLSNAIQECSNTAKITSANSNYVGGLVGDITCFGSYTLKTLQNSGDVKGKENVGGLIGKILNARNEYNNDTHYTLAITNVKNTGNFVNGKNNVGGVIGCVSASVTGDYADGSVTVLINNITCNAKALLDAYDDESLDGAFIATISTDNSSSKMEDWTLDSFAAMIQKIGHMEKFTIVE